MYDGSEIVVIVMIYRERTAGEIRESMRGDKVEREGGE